jgi:hypothetical protein
MEKWATLAIFGKIQISLLGHFTRSMLAFRMAAFALIHGLEIRQILTLSHMAVIGTFSREGDILLKCQYGMDSAVWLDVAFY